MDYEKKYNESMLRAEEAVQKGCLDNDMFDIIFPSEESEDERIRKAIVCGMNVLKEQKKETFAAVPINDCLAWLEKQKDILGERAKNITANMFEDGIKGIQRELIEFLSNTVNASWVDIIRSADAYAERIRNTIKKQKEQKPTEWKPTEEQFNYLAKAIMTLGEEGDCKTAGVLSEIRNGLKCSFPDWKMSSDYPEEGCNVSLNGEVKKIQEWSEDFDKEVESVHKRYPEVSFAKLTRIAHHFAKWADKYKSTEWSEELAILEGYIISGDWSDAHKERALDILKSLRPFWNCSMIQWTGENLKEVIDFTGKSPKFNEWFKSWDEFESYVHSHGDIIKLFSKDGSHYEVPVGAWIIKTPDGYNIPSQFKFIQKSSWSEEEKYFMDILIARIFRSPNITTILTPDDCYKFEKALTKIRNKMDLQYSEDERQANKKHIDSLCSQSKPVEWSEEDENKLNHILEIVHIASGREVSIDEKEELESFLKSLRPQPHWKPSEEQMDRLVSIVAALRKDCCDDMADFLAEIYHELEKL